MDDIIRLVKKCTLNILLFPLRILPLKKNRVMLYNDLALNYSDNSKYVCEYLDKNYHGKFDIIIPVKDIEKFKYLEARGFKVIKINSMKYFIYAMTSKVFLTNSGGYSYLPLKKKQYVINTWHGGGAYKKCGLDMYEDTWAFRKDLKMNAKRTSVFLSTCKRFSKEFNRCMLIPTEKFWEIGMPRNDMLKNQDEEIYYKVRNKIGLDRDDKFVLYAPTYRKKNDNYFKDSVALPYNIDSKRVCEALERRFGGKWKFAVRLHPCITNRNDIVMDNAIDLTDYDDMQELLVAADAMINDFSSSMWDYMLTGRPSFLYAEDLQHYIDTTEVYTPVSEWPYPKSINNEELINNILSFDENDYSKKCVENYKSLGGCETGKATQLVCERIYKVCYGRYM